MAGAPIPPLDAAYVRAMMRALVTVGCPVQAGQHHRGPQATVYQFRPAPAAMAVALRQRPAIEAAINTPGVRLAQHGAWLAVEVPRRDRQAVAFNGAALGVTLRGGLLAPRLDDAAPHGLVAATTGGGKTVALRTLALMESQRPGTRLVLVDLEGESWAGFNGRGHTIASTEAEVSAALDWCKRRMDAPADGGRVVLMIDEAQMMPPAAMATVREIAERGRKHALHLVLATQHPRYDVLDRRATANLGLRIIGRVQDAKAAALVGMPGAELLTGLGDVLVGMPGCEPVRAQVAFAADPAAFLATVDPVDMLTPADEAAMIAWAREAGASARAIRLQFGIGQDKARRVRDAAGLTDRDDSGILRPIFGGVTLSAAGQS